MHRATRLPPVASDAPIVEKCSATLRDWPHQELAVEPEVDFTLTRHADGIDIRRTSPVRSLALRIDAIWSRAIAVAVSMRKSWLPWVQSVGRTLMCGTPESMMTLCLKSCLAP